MTALSSTPRAQQLTSKDALDANEEYQRRGWTDGLPITPPTPQAVALFLDAAGLEADDIIGIEPVREREIPAEKVAINAVMAGCLPSYFPVVVAILEAMCDDRYLLHGASSSTGGSAPFIVVNGPIRAELDMHATYNALANGSRANASIGRAIRLLLLNLLQYAPDQFDRSALGHPGKYTFCIAEDEENSNWSSLAQERGVTSSGDPVSAVTVMACASPHIVLHEWSIHPEELMETVAAAMRANMLTYSIWPGNYALVVPKQIRDTLIAAGWSKADVRDYIYESARVKRKDWESVGKGMLVNRENSDREYRALETPDDLLVVAAGGPANGFAAIVPPWYGILSRAVTRKVNHAPYVSSTHEEGEP